MKTWLAFACLALAPLWTHAQGWPSKTVRIIVPHPAGGPADVPPRAMAQSLAQTLGQPFIVENRLGADGIIGAEACAKAAPDGHTLCSMSNGVSVVNPVMHLKLPYEPGDFVPVVQTGTLYSVVLAHPSVPGNSMPELIAALKAKPESLSYGTYGQITLAYFLVEWLKVKMGASFHQVPYKSSSQALQALVSGEVQAASYALGAARKLVQAGKLKALAVNSRERLAALPDVPTLRELGIEVDVRSWFGFYAPARTSAEIVRRLNAEIARLLADREFKAKFITAQGFEADWPTGAPAEEFAKYFRSEREQFQKLANAMGIKPQ
jgi:tripartite-type tricarboxylate transporter receptor subunit TctC